jgi:hypothetical protein
MKSRSMHFFIEVNSLNSLFVDFFLAGIASQGVTDNDPTVWLDGARPANTCIPPSFLETCCTAM